MSYRILHIATHIGGGVGSVLTNWIKADSVNCHVIMCLGRNFYGNYDASIVMEDMRFKTDEICDAITRSDIVIIHFWNHPYLFEFLANTTLPECRVCVWSHVSGLNTPYVFPRKLIDISDKFIFASPISYKAKEIIGLPKNMKGKLGHIWTTGDISTYLNIKPVPHNGFNIGCIGTLDYSKLHPDFVRFCSKIKIPDVKFIMIGGGCDTEIIKQQVLDMGIADKFEFTGVIKDIRPYLEIIDVFGYPLNPTHFGTCEQVIGEAVAAGVIPIVMKNPAEEYILFQSIVRFVCDNEDEYVHNIELLYREIENKDKIIDLMQRSVVELYSTNRMISDWNAVFESVMLCRKKGRKWPGGPFRRGYEIFIESLGEHGGVLRDGNVNEIRELFGENLQWKSKSKGSPLQYLEAYPDDGVLRKWVNILEGVA